MNQEGSSQAVQVKGLDSELFEEFLDFLRNDPVFDEAEMIVLFGSRTQGERAYAVQQDSDLDIQVFWKSEDLDEILERSQQVNDRLQPWSHRFGFPVSIQFPALMSANELISELPDAAEVRESFRLIDRIAEDGRWERDLHKGLSIELLNRAHHTYINPGAIFIFPAENSSSLSRRVAQLGYRSR